MPNCVSGLRFSEEIEGTRLPTALDGAEARMKVAQELMRHANIATTMDVYTGVLERDKREVVGAVARSLVGLVQ